VIESLRKQTEHKTYRPLECSIDSQAQFLQRKRECFEIMRTSSIQQSSSLGNLDLNSLSSLSTSTVSSTGCSAESKVDWDLPDENFVANFTPTVQALIS
jgi:hypothetical protein